MWNVPPSEGALLRDPVIKARANLGHKQMLRFAWHDIPFGCGRWAAL